MRLPKRIRVGWRWYRVTRWKSSHAASVNRFGQCDTNLAIIHVSTVWGREKAANTFLHEVLHAVWRERGLGDDAKEETAVAEFTSGLCALARDNPDVVQSWLDVMRSNT